MVAVVEVDLGELGVRLPRGEVAMVIGQPFVVFVPQEPFMWAPEEQQRALECIDETLAVSRSCAHGADKTHFTIFPECTLPGLEGVDRITAAMLADDWPTETVVIGGVDGLTKDKFVELVNRPNTTYDHLGNRLDRVLAHQWVNCVVTWTKLATGEVYSWVQPKLSAAWIERDVRNMSMYEGRSIYVFKGNHSNADVPYQFATLLCYDWIGRKDNKRMWEWLLDGIATHAGQFMLPLTWLFVAQCNPAPSHASFMGQVGPFFDQTRYPRVTRDETCLVMANVAGREAPGQAKEFGQSAVIFTPNRFSRPDCMPTYGNGGALQRGTEILENFRDAVFRERGACIHSFLAIHPSTLPHGSAGRQFALRRPTVHPFDGVHDPRAPADAVPAIVKWMNDELDETKSLATKDTGLPLTAVAAAAHQRAVGELRTLKAEALETTVKFASLTACKGTADEWKVGERDAVQHILHTFSILEVGQYPATFHGNGAQATIMRDETSFEVIAVMGTSHEDCDKHVLNRLPTHRGQLVIVSRDEDNNPWDERFKSIYDQVPDEPSTEAKFTEPTSAIIRVGYRYVLDAYRNAANQAELKEALDAKLS